MVYHGLQVHHVHHVHPIPIRQPLQLNLLIVTHSSKLLENVKDGDQGPEHPKLALYRLFHAAKQGDRPESPTGFIGLPSGNQTWLGNLRSIEL